jgi:hypothetical protein
MFSDCIVFYRDTRFASEGNRRYHVFYQAKPNKLNCYSLEEIYKRHGGGVLHEMGIQELVSLGGYRCPMPCSFNFLDFLYLWKLISYE